MICSVKEYLLLSQCNIGNALPWFSLCLALLVRDEGRHLGVFFSSLFCFCFFEAGKPSQPKNVHIHPWSAGPALRRLSTAGTVICSFRTQLHDAELLSFVSVECCTDRNCNTLLSSSLQRCYINGVCFAFQLAALWKRRSVICPWEHRLAFKCGKQKWRNWNLVGWSGHPDPHATRILFGTMRKKSPRMEREIGDKVNSAPDIVCMFCSCSMSNNRAASPLQPGSQSAVVNQSNPINRQLFG